MNTQVKTYLLGLIFVLGFITGTPAQNKYDLSQIKDETIEFIKQPAKWEKEDWLKLGLISAGTFLIMQTDQNIRTEILKDRTYYKSVPIEFGRMWGEVYTGALVAGAFGLHGILADNTANKKIAFEIIQAAIYTGIITQSLKIAFGRAKPLANEGSSQFHPFSFRNNDFMALPSGHTSLAFSVSTVLSKNAKSDFLKIIAYVPAVLTAVSRVYQDKHWTSDVFLGAAIGYFVGDWVTNLHDEKESPVQILSIYPISIKVSIF